MRELYDLTTTRGLRVARGALSRLGRLLDSPAAWIVSPAGKLAYELSKRGSNTRQGEVARDLIRAGRAEGLKRMTIRMSESAGVDLAVPIEGIPIRTKLGVDGTLEIEVEYE